MKIDPATREIIEQAGRALYGDFWQNRLAIALGLHKRTLNRMLYGTKDVDDVQKFKDRVWAVCYDAIKNAHHRYVTGCNAALLERDRVCRDVSAVAFKLAPPPPNSWSDFRAVAHAVEDQPLPGAGLK